MSFCDLQKFNTERPLNIPLNILKISSTPQDRYAAKEATKKIAEYFIGAMEGTSLSVGFITLKLSDIVNGITKDEWFNISYENRAKNLHKAIKRKVSDITKENFITQPCYSVFQSSDNLNNPLFHCLFLKVVNNPDQQYDDLDNILAFTDKLSTDSSNEKISKSQKFLRALLFLYIQADWLVNTNLYPSYIIDARININSTPYYYLDGNSRFFELVEPLITVNGSNEIITNTRLQRMEVRDIETDDGEEPTDIDGGLFKSYLTGTNLTTDFLQENYQQIKNNAKTIQPSDARKAKNGHFIGYTNESFLKSMSVYQSYIAKLIEDLLIASDISYTRKTFNSSFRVRPFANINYSSKLPMLYIIDNAQFINNTLSLKADSDILNYLVGLFPNILSGAQKTEKKHKDTTYIVYEIKLLKQQIDIIKSKYSDYLVSFMKEHYEQVIVLTQQYLDFSQLESNAHYFFLQSEKQDNSDYWYINNAERKQKFLQEKGVDWQQCFHPTESLKINNSDKDKDKEYITSSTKNFLSLLDFHRNEYFLTDHYTELKLQNLQSAIDKSAIKVIQGLHIPSIKDLLGLLNKEQGEKGYKADVYKKIANEMLVKHYLASSEVIHLNHAHTSKVNDDIEVDLTPVTGVYKAYFIRNVKSEKRINGKKQLLFFASEITFKAEKNDLHILGKRIIRSDAMLREAQPLLQAHIFPKFYNDSFIIVDETNKQSLISYNSLYTGRLLPSMELGAFMDMCYKIKYDGSYAINRQQDGDIGSAFPYYFTPTTQYSSAWIYAQNNRENGLTILMTNKDKPKMGVQKGIVLKNILILDDDGRRVDVTNNRLIELYLNLTTFDVIRLNDVSSTTLLEKLTKTFIVN